MEEIQSEQPQQEKSASFQGKVVRALPELLFFIVTIFFFFGLARQFYVRAMVPGGVNLTVSESSGDSLAQNKAGNINVLVLGVDSVEGTHRSDTIFVLGINPAKDRISMLSIPRDTRVLINGRARKINEILPRYGEQVLRSLIEDLMKIEISRYAKVDFQGFINIIDILGGIEIDIDKPMHYDDNWGKLHIHFNKGRHKLDGKQALNYVRFRADAHADLGRIKRQQKFIRQLIQTVMTPATFVKIPKIVAEGINHVQTDFSLQEIIALFRSFADFRVSFRTSSLPGEARYVDKISYFLPYRDRAVELGSSQFSDLAALELVASFTPNLASGTVNEN